MSRFNSSIAVFRGSSSTSIYIDYEYEDRMLTPSRKASGTARGIDVFQFLTTGPSYFTEQIYCSFLSSPYSFFLLPFFVLRPSSSPSSASIGLGLKVSEG